MKSVKATLYDVQGNKKGTADLPAFFGERVREDIVQKCAEAERTGQPYGPNPRAGLRQSASGTISHKRHDWKGHYGRGTSRAPRKTMWRRGTQFYWVGADVPGARGGRKAHPPRIVEVEKKINKKEKLLALHSALAATAQEKYISQRYSSLSKAPEAPFVIESLPTKAKPFFATLKSMLGDNVSLAIKSKSVRSGKGKIRGRKYKENAGILVVTSSKETARLQGVDVTDAKTLTITDLYPLGRLTLYTQKALEELSGKGAKQ